MPKYVYMYIYVYVYVCIDKSIFIAQISIFLQSNLHFILGITPLRFF